MILYDEEEQWNRNIKSRLITCMVGMLFPKLYRFSSFFEKTLYKRIYKSSLCLSPLIHYSSTLSVHFSSMLETREVTYGLASSSGPNSCRLTYRPMLVLIIILDDHCNILILRSHEHIRLPVLAQNCRLN